MHAIGIDVGSTNVKVVLVDDHQGVLAAASRAIETRRDGDAIGQDADGVWDAACGATREVTAAAGAAAERIATIGVCSQYSSLVPVDDTGAALAPIKLYLDTRGSEHCWAILERHPEGFEIWVERHGIPPIGGGLTLGHLLHFQHDEPEVHARTGTYLEVMDLVALRLTGRAAATPSTMFAAQLCDHRSAGTDYDDDLVAMSGVDPRTLPPLLPPDGVHGTLLDDVADQLGLPHGVEVRSGMNDTQASAFATGALADPRRCGLMVGTTAVLIQSMSGPGVDLEHEVLAMPAPVPGRFVVMAENGIAGRAVERSLELLSPTPPDPERHFAELEAALVRSPPGAGGVLFLPWLAGSMSPASAPDMRGGFVGMTLHTERTDLLRATVEGVARNLRWLLPAVGALSGTPIDRVVFGGGGARSPGVAQVLADVLGLPVGVVDEPGLAAARAVAGVALAHTAGDDPCSFELPVAATYDPDPAAADVHDRLQPIFESAFTALRPVCEALRP